MATIAEALQIAFEFHQTGRFDEAEELYGRILEADPEQPHALHLCGLLVAQLGRLEEAADLLARAVAVDPLAADPHGNRGKVLRALGRPAEASRCFRAAAALRPELWEAWEGLGHAARELGDPAASALGFGRAAIGGQGAANHYHWALALEAAGRPDAAVPALERAAALDPAAGAVPARLGALLHGLGREPQAMGWYRRALMLRPDHADVLNNLAALEQSAGRLETTVRLLGHAAVLRPEDGGLPAQRADALLALGRARCAAGRQEEGLDRIRQAAALDPSRLEIVEALALLLFETGRFATAAAAYRRVVALDPASLAGHYNGALCAKALGAVAPAVAGLRRARHLSGEPWVHSTLLTTLLLLPDLDNATLAAEVESWRDRFGRTRPDAPARPPLPGPAARPLRVGYVSAYLHPGNRLLDQMGPLLRAHDRSRVRPFVYGDAPYGDPRQDPVRGWAEGWIDSRGMDDAELAARIRADGIDVLVCLIGHTRGERMGLFTHRPARRQFTLYGMLSSGVEAMDGWLTDAAGHPPDTTERFTERLIRLPNLFLFEPPLDAPPVSPPPVLTRGTVTFGSFNLDAKVNERVVAVWARLLAEVPGSRLLLKSRGTGFADPAGRDRITGLFARHGIGPDRLQLAPPAVDHAAHLRLYGMVDVALDTFPYGGCLTSFDALSMGVPVVTLAGDRFIGRMTASLLRSLGRTEWVAASEDEYLAIARTLAVNINYLSSTRLVLRNQMIHSPLCDAASFARSLEEVFCCGFVAP
ncbi:tetratricopeptide repeat protein [Azospirillum thermophilum]|uniref:protein O-GlcNAc transferase n=1 Tax=Azospirillum thermophilum TaxID=2202148 RepID=A0A2S2CLZ8_9PROT|nr:tetratricopeptide repeat protein [Azospirillum thermophilum]AWK85486.1 hypothetical protein DEW08_04285 [Azospirillum thermophilum]